MKKGYIKKDQRKKILLLGDDLRTPSGVGTQSKNLVLSTCHHYNWVQIAGSLKHPDKGKRLELNESITKGTGVEDPSDQEADHIENQKGPKCSIWCASHADRRAVSFWNKERAVSSNRTGKGDNRSTFAA